MSMLSTGRPTRPDATVSTDAHATLTGGEGLLQHEPLIFELGGWDKTGVDLPPVADALGADDLGDLVRAEPIGLPGFANFWGELTVFVALWQFSPWITAVAVAGVVLIYLRSRMGP